MAEFNFTPKQWVLVRDNESYKWGLAQYSHYDETEPMYKHCLSGRGGAVYCIPYKGNENLLGKTDAYVEPYEPKDGDLVVMYEQFIAICKNPQIDEMYGGYKFNVYAYSRLSYTDKFYFSMPCTKQEEIRLATEEEKQLFLSKLAEIGKKWNAEKKCIEDIYQPKDGDFVTYTYTYKNGCNEYVAIYLCKESEIDCFYVDLCLKNNIEGLADRITYKNRFERGYTERRPSTDSEKQLLLSKLHEIGKEWNPEKKCIEDVWAPKDGDFVVSGWERGDRYCHWIAICRDGDNDTKYYSTYAVLHTKYSANSGVEKALEIQDDTCDGPDYTRPATKEEKQQLLDALHEAGKDWNPEKKEIVEYKWIPCLNEHYFTVGFDKTKGGFFVFKTLWNNDGNDMYNAEHGFIFRTEEEAEKEAKKTNELLKGGKE